MLDSLFTSPFLFLVYALSLLIAITFHEFAHALAADRLGDPTPKLAGRLTLNPLAHLDPLGTLALLLVGFGWGRPVPVDTYNLRSPRRDNALISFAGPASNLTLALLLAVIMHFFPLPLLLNSFFAILISLNLVLAVFNLVPVYPLDGEKILAGLLPADLASEYAQIMHRYGTLILVFLLLPLGGTSPISALISPIISALSSLLL